VQLHPWRSKTESGAHAALFRSAFQPSTLASPSREAANLSTRDEPQAGGNDRQPYPIRQR